VIAPVDIVLLTGAGGSIGLAFLDDYLTEYGKSYRVRPMYRNKDAIDRRFDDVAIADIEDLGALTRSCGGVHTVVHLAANSDWQADFCDGLVGPNVIGAYHMFEAARRAGVRRVVYASSVHAVMGYPVDRQAHEHDASRPDTLYGVTKVFGEALCASYAYEYGLSCIAVRIGAFVPRDEHAEIRESDNPQHLDIVITQRDMSQLLHRCITAPDDVRYAIVHGLSDNRFKRLDLTETRALLGYEPEDDAFRMSEEIGFGTERKV
jgi:nucleoside-diphosphate-sugar epimerase